MDGKGQSRHSDARYLSPPYRSRGPIQFKTQNIPHLDVHGTRSVLPTPLTNPTTPSPGNRARPPAHVPVPRPRPASLASVASSPEHTRRLAWQWRSIAEKTGNASSNEKSKSSRQKHVYNLRLSLCFSASNLFHLARGMHTNRHHFFSGHADDRGLDPFARTIIS
ncbi:uncharacterized protein FOMMEDRAFT_155159 [Fomitiporia mediterranea MF3/22]|uniref:uncharacterized protein n=1 Tax=Fomitiporia mediterranea (strain MF3/22) TaxID=694068 RepID=UPI0004407F9C|nr:uncharacterized protein FOMMEDRAFT_155159 [Fomitiporia mediterranea MF3/22]EJD04030.1 hypothetical protein FOMMEDRAFT_155159 [Fomitiporia mediterranea MF3/22]